MEESHILEGAILRVPVAASGARLLGLFLPGGQHGHLLCREAPGLLSGLEPDPKLALGGVAWTVIRSDHSAIELAATSGILTLGASFRVDPHQPVLRARYVATNRGPRRLVRLGLRGALVPGGGGHHGYCRTSHFAQKVFCQSSAGFSETPHRKYSHAVDRWDHVEWIAFIDRTERAGAILRFDASYPSVVVCHAWNEMEARIAAVPVMLGEGQSVEFGFEALAVGGLRRVDFVSEAVVVGLSAPANVAPGEPFEVEAEVFAVRPVTGEGTFHGAPGQETQQWPLALAPAESTSRVFAVAAFPDPIRLRYDTFEGLAVAWRSPPLMLRLPSGEAKREVTISGLVAVVETRLKEAQREAEARLAPPGGAERWGLVAALAEMIRERFADRPLDEKGLEFIYGQLDGITAVLKHEPDPTPAGNRLRQLADDPLAGPALAELVAATRREMAQDVPLGYTKLRMTEGPDYFQPFRLLGRLAVALAATGEQAFAARARAELLKIARNHRTYGSCFGESLFISMTTADLLSAYDLVTPLLTREDHAEIMHYLAWCLDILEADVNYTGRNHDVWHASATMWLAERLRQLPWAERAATRAATILRGHLDLQREDGGWTEQSATYHDMNTLGLLLGAFAQQRYGRDFGALDLARPGAGGATLGKMAEWSKDIAGPEALYPALDDSHLYLPPSADLFVLAGRIEPSLPLLAYARALLANGIVPERAATWLSFPAAEETASANPSPFRELLPGTGHAILRRGEKGAATRVILEYGPHGGWHGHYDKLGIEVSRGKCVFLPDAGMGLYEDAVHFEWHKRTRAHNTVEVDEKDQHPGRGELLRFDSAACGAYVVAASALYPGVRHERRVLLVPDGAWLFVLDQLVSSTPHTYRLWWHLAGEGKVEPDFASTVRENIAVWLSLTPGTIRATGLGPWGREKKAFYVTQTVTGTEMFSFLTAIALLPKGLARPEIVEYDPVAGKVAVRGSGKSWRARLDREGFELEG